MTKKAMLEDDGDGLRCAHCRSRVAVNIEAIREHFKCDKADESANPPDKFAPYAGTGSAHDIDKT